MVRRTARVAKARCGSRSAAVARSCHAASSVSPQDCASYDATPEITPGVFCARLHIPTNYTGCLFRMTIDVAALRKALEAEVQGEVRFDAVSRALYSTDASVYQIEPLGVVVPRSRDDVLRVIRLCGQFRCPLTLRGGGTSQAGQAIG